MIAFVNRQATRSQRHQVCIGRLVCMLVLGFIFLAGCSNDASVVVTIVDVQTTTAGDIRIATAVNAVGSYRIETFIVTDGTTRRLSEAGGAARDLSKGHSEFDISFVTDDLSSVRFFVRKDDSFSLALAEERILAEFVSPDLTGSRKPVRYGIRRIR